MDKTARAVISGSRLFNIAFGLPRTEENITRSFGTLQSGSPPGRAHIDRRGRVEPGRMFSGLPIALKCNSNRAPGEITWVLIMNSAARSPHERPRI